MAEIPAGTSPETGSTIAAARSRALHLRPGTGQRLLRNGAVLAHRTWPLRRYQSRRSELRPGGKMEGDLWAGKAWRGRPASFIDDRADERQAEVLPASSAAGRRISGSSSLRCSPKAGRCGAWNAHRSPSRSRPTAPSVERRSPAK